MNADYHQISEDKMPFKWLPLESIEDRVFTSKRLGYEICVAWLVWVCVFFLSHFSYNLRAFSSIFFIVMCGVLVCWCGRYAHQVVHVLCDRWSLQWHSDVPTYAWTSSYTFGGHLDIQLWRESVPVDECHRNSAASSKRTSSSTSWFCDLISRDVYCMHSNRSWMY